MERNLFGSQRQMENEMRDLEQRHDDANRRVNATITELQRELKEVN